jgi:hypothetical protein
VAPWFQRRRIVEVLPWALQFVPCAEPKPGREALASFRYMLELADRKGLKVQMGYM